MQELIEEIVNRATDYGNRTWFVGKEPKVDKNSITTHDGYEILFTENEDGKIHFILNSKSGDTVHEATMNIELAIAVLPEYIGEVILR